MIKKRLKDIGMSLAPALTLELLSARSQRLIRESERESGRHAASCKFVETHGRTVLGGPFTGMVYPDSTARQRNLVHRLTGSYECELHSWIEEIVARDYAMLIDIGTADGFYAVGFGLRMPDTRVVAFDTDVWARRATQALITENGANNVEVETMCDARWVNAHLLPGSLVFSDCEGYEAVLFDPEKCPILKECDLLIELHERPSPGVEMLLRERFAHSHDYRTVTYANHDPTLFPQLAAIEPAMRSVVINEGRGGPQNVIFLTRSA
jgi:hypothetical protein